MRSGQWLSRASRPYGGSGPSDLFLSVQRALHAGVGGFLLGSAFGRIAAWCYRLCSACSARSEEFFITWSMEFWMRKGLWRLS